ncbi:hypothetical protein ACKWTF_016754 [Chironomus riparius]
MKIVNGVLITFWNFKKTTMKVFVLLFFIAAANAKLLIEKWEMQVDSTYSDVKYSVKDQTYMTIDAHTLKAADDVVIEAAVYSKVDGVFNPFVKPEPIHVCKIHEHEDPLIKFIHDEIIKFGNITKVTAILSILIIKIVYEFDIILSRHVQSTPTITTIFMISVY